MDDLTDMHPLAIGAMGERYDNALKRYANVIITMMDTLGGEFSVERENIITQTIDRIVDIHAMRVRISNEVDGRTGIKENRHD